MQFITRAIVLTLAIGSLSCVGAETGESEIRALVGRFLESVNAANTDGFMTFFSEDATAFLPSSGERKRGRDAIRAAIVPTFAQGPRVIRAEAKDLVVAIDGTTAIASFDAGSGKTHARRTLMLRRIGGEWKIVHLHASNVADSD